MQRTSAAPDLTSQLTRALEMIDQAAADACSRVAAGPDNPAVTRRSEHCFTISFNETVRGGGMDVFRHDWFSQYRYVADLIRRRRFALLRELVDNGNLREAGYGTRQFAPEVVERIRSIVGNMHLAPGAGDLPAAVGGPQGHQVDMAEAAPGADPRERASGDSQRLRRPKPR